jgi:ATP-dependent Clp protease ATP-binding subunit ClpA
MAKSEPPASFDPELESTLQRALNEAENRKSETVTLEHLLLSLTEDRDASEVLRAYEVDLSDLRESIDEFLKNKSSKKIINEKIEVEESVQRVLQRAILHTNSSNRLNVNGASLLVALFS